MMALMKNSGKINVFLFNFFLPSSALIVLIAYIVFSHVVVNERKISEKLERDTISIYEHIISDEIEFVTKDLLILADSSHMKALADGREENRKLLTDDFILFSKIRGIYDQIRYLDSEGMEIVRVNAVKGGASAVPDAELQNKKKRYYFEDSYEIDRGEIYISPLDLNIEHSAIEIPLKPMIRIGTPVFDSRGVKKGVVLLNYLAKRLLNEIEKLDGKSFGRSVLVNPEGYFLKGLAPEEEWGFMFPDRKNRTMEEFDREAWKTIQNTNSGQISSHGYLFTFATVYPVTAAFRSSSGSGDAFSPSRFKIDGSGYFWKIISVVDPPYFAAKRNRFLVSMSWLLIPTLLLLAGGSWILTHYRIRRIRAEKAFQRANEDLERKVGERTWALHRVNTELGTMVDELQKTRDGLADSDRYYRSLINSIQEEIMVVTKDYKVTDVNDTFVRATGLSRDQVVNLHCYETYHRQDSPCIIDGARCPIDRVIETGNPERITHQHKNASGEDRWVEIVFAPLRDKNDEISQVIKVSRDIHYKIILEQQLRQAQKMEAIGRLSGGIAHDFNNILFPILGYAEISMEQIMPEQEELKLNLEEIMKGALRARDLVKQILAFSYQSDNEMKPIRVDIVVKEALKLIKATIPSTIEIRASIDSKCGSVLADATQIHQIVMNLCTNAYQAMEGEPGFIEVNLKKVEYPEETAVGSDVLKGDYILLTVFNTGKIIPLENMDRIFEPFFTTKEKGKGTGLGLSVVYSIVKACGGTITVKSEEGEGTFFGIHFPSLGDQSELKETNGKDGLYAMGRGEHIMLVDDDPTILALEKKVLENLGYKISDFRESMDALTAFRESPERYDLVVTDYTMPAMTGETLAREIMALRDDIPIVLVTGFSGKFNMENARKIGIKSFITKPVIMNNMVRNIRQVLDETRNGCIS
jgi:PAS domain S-box-containing protein